MNSSLWGEAFLRSPVPAMIRAEDRVLAISAGWTDRTGYTLQDMPTLREWVHLAYRHMPVEAQTALYERRREFVELTEQSEVGEFEVQTKWGARRTWVYTVTPLPSEGGEALIMVTAKDLTEERAADQLKDEFIAMASHELRTPLTAIKGYAHMARTRLKRSALPEAEQLLKWFTVVEEQADRLAGLATELLDTSRLMRGDLPSLMKPERFDLRDMLSLAATLARTKYPELPVHLYLPSEAVWVRGDRAQLERVVNNLLDNAAKYAGESTPVLLTLNTQEGETAQVRVSDKGPGIPEGELEHIFDRFYRGQGSGTRARPGLGMGLYISSAIVIEHGGFISVDSIEGLGTEFLVQLPLDRHAK